MTKLTLEKIKEIASIYKGKACNVSQTCAAINISRETWYKWARRNKDFSREINEQEAALIDFAETQLLKNIKEGKETSLIFYLKNKKPDQWNEKRFEQAPQVNVNISLDQMAQAWENFFGFKANNQLASVN